MKPSALLSLFVISTAAIAQSAMPPGYNHPPMAGHGAPGDSGTGQPAVAPYQFRPYPTAPIARPAAPSNEGTVLSIQTGGGYSYIEASTPSGNVWLAAPEAKFAVGDKILYQNGAVMRNFSSKGAGRTFPSIIFTGGVVLAGSVPAGSGPATGHGAPGQGTPGHGTPGGMPSPFNLAPPPSSHTEGSVVQVQVAGGYSYVEVKTSEGNTWLAAPMTKLAAGDKVRYQEGAVMQNFSSRALNRTFPAITFVDSVSVVK